MAAQLWSVNTSLYVYNYLVNLTFKWTYAYQADRLMADTGPVHSAFGRSRLNQIQHVIHSQIQSLVALSRAAEAMSHSTTTGRLRESYLTMFLKELLPHGVTATSGVLCDCLGRTSRQLDLVLTLDSSLPVISMQDGIALIPVDSVLLAIEIKSTLNTCTLTHVEKQNASIQELNVSNEVPGGEKFIIPTMVVAMEESKLSCDTVSDWIQRTANTVACCVIGKYFIKKEEPYPMRVESAGDGAFNETLAFVACLYHALLYLKGIRNFEPNWVQYLLS